MLTSSFSIFPGIGPATERRLWDAGILSWHGLLEYVGPPVISRQRSTDLKAHVLRANEAYEAGEFGYLGRLLGQSYVWRLWETLADDAVCIDIETDGGVAGEGHVTVAGFYSHGEYRGYVKGVDLCRDAVQAELSRARLLVSYFGGGFDLPFLKASYPGLELDAPHFDLCPAGHRAGLKGGLKKVERLVGISREPEVEGLGGYEAVLLWRAHMDGVPGALEKLVMYNREDTVNLHTLAGIIYERLSEATGLPAMLRS